MLTYYEAVKYLLQREIMSSQSAFENDLSVIDSSRRNHNYAIINEREPCFLVKQGINTDTAMTVAHEAMVYQFFHTDNSYRKLRQYLPRFYQFDIDKCIIILEFFRNSENLREHFTRCGRFSTHLAMHLGGALATLHYVMEVDVQRSMQHKTFAQQPPWVLSLHHPYLSTMQDVSGSSLQLIKIIQQFSEFCEWLDMLRHDWRADTLIHFDLRWDNCLVSVPSSFGLKGGLKIVDWEFAGLGDPCWDVGSVFSDYLSFWLLSIPTTGDAALNLSFSLARYPISRMQPAIRSFWESYTRQMKLDAHSSQEWLLRSVRYCAARLVQTAFEQTQVSAHVAGNIVFFLQLSLNILQRPHEAIVHLLGIPLQEMI